MQRTFRSAVFLLRNTPVACVCTGALLGLSMRASAGPVQKLESELGRSASNKWSKARIIRGR